MTPRRVRHLDGRELLRITGVLLQLTVFTLGGIALHLLGTPAGASTTIAVLAAIATVFTPWTRALRMQGNTDQTKR